MILNCDERRNRDDAYYMENGWVYIRRNFRNTDRFNNGVGVNSMDEKEVGTKNAGIQETFVS